MYVTLSKLHPYTLITVAAMLMIGVLVLNSFPVSLGVVLFGALIGILATRYSTVLVALCISLPMVLAFGLIYVPFGDIVTAHLGPIPLTRDGWMTTRDLSTRFTALIMTGLVGASIIHRDTFLRALQLSWPAPLVYMIGSALRLIPMANQRVTFISEIQKSRGQYPTSWFARWRQLALPMTVGLVNDAAGRGRPLERMGVARPGKRTLYTPVPNPLGQRIVRWSLVALTAVLIGLHLGGMGL